jgi:hypothetical protein
MRERTILQIWIAIALLAAVGLAVASWYWGTTGWLAWLLRLLAGAVTLVGALRILMLARLIYRAGKARMAGLWIVFSMVTAAISTLWLLGPLVG